MKKIFSWLSDNILYVYTLFLLAFIPLYPKLPLFNVDRTWVYIRADDFAIAIGVLLFVIQLVRRKAATLKTPLTLPIIAFWVIGAVSTAYAVLFIFPDLAGQFPHIAALHYLRRIEYLSVFFIAFSAIRTKKQLYGVIAVIALTLLAVVGYGLGQRYLGFHAYLTMNEEFAKGIPLQLSALARIPSTFAGHYDLAAYLVTIIAVTAAMITGFKKWWLKISFLLISASGLILLLMTASRVSFAVYLVTVAFLLIIQKKKLFIIPVIVASILLANTFEGISERFASTISQADVIVDARTGKAVGIAREEIDEKTGKKRIVINEDEELTGEDLPQGSQYINVPSQGEEGQTIYKRDKEGRIMTTLNGEFVVKKAFAYDVSFTTRLQGTWPRAMEAFQRNFLLGSGYSSISLASDGNYVRILGEVGVLGFISFFAIFLIFFICVYRILPDIKSKPARHFVLGVSAGIFGLALNAVLIDVFEASKVAYVSWMLMGITLAVLWLYKKREINLIKELKNILLSVPAIIIYFVISAFVIFWSSLSNYFVADDFVWLRWAADCTLTSPQLNGVCPGIPQLFAQYFTDAQGFFYRPGTKIYFYAMYAFFWLNPVMYHVVSVLLHALITSLLFLLGLRILKSKVFAFIFAALFLTMSAHYETVFWIAVTGHMISIASVLLSLLLFTYYRSSKNIALLVTSIISMAIAPFFHEYGVVGPVLLVAYSMLTEKEKVKSVLKKQWTVYIPYLLIIPTYLLIRAQAGSAGFQGDYDYNLFKLPVNFLGNAAGYVIYLIVGIESIPWYQALRSALRDDLLTTSIIAVVITFAVLAGGYFVVKMMSKETRKTVMLGVVFFVISMAPFLGLGNIAERYIYFGSFGLLLLFVLLLRYLHSNVAKSKPMLAHFLLVAAVFGIIWLNVSSLQQLNKDWQRASDITESTIDEFGYYAAYYEEELSDSSSSIYYLINVPKRIDSAWVFPLGIEDAVWFTTQNQKVTVTQGATIEEAEVFLEQNPETRIFQFDKNGNMHPLLDYLPPSNE